MSDNTILDLSEKLEGRLLGRVKDSLKDQYRELVDSSFRTLAHAHGLSDAWVTEKAATTLEIIDGILEPLPSTLSIRIPGELKENQLAAVSAALEEWASQHHHRVVLQCLAVTLPRLPGLALPSDA